MAARRKTGIQKTAKNKGRTKATRRKNAPGQGRRPNDPRGITRPKMMYLIPEVADAMEVIAIEKGWPSASRMLSAWIDQGCPGVKRGPK